MILFVVGPVRAAEPECEWRKATVLSWSQDSRPHVMSSSSKSRTNVYSVPVRFYVHRLRAGDVVYAIEGGKKPLEIGKELEFCLQEREKRVLLVKRKYTQFVIRSDKTKYVLVGQETDAEDGEP
ncbi:MAG: hypothetical protein ACRD4U_03645 [Candidatus Acidiferrales bacterium]